MRVETLHRYPVKGLSPEARDSLRLTAGDYVPGDRLYAIENGPCGFDPAEPRHQAKIKFLMLMRNESLARLRTRYLDETRTLVVEREGAAPVGADLSTAEGRAAIEALMRGYLPGALRGPAKVLTAPDGFRFTDSRSGYLSIINLASLDALERAIGRPLDPLRFRANVAVSGLPAWAEFDRVGRTLRGGDGLALKVLKPIVRCAATEVDPTTGERDVNLVRALARHFDHMDFGIYAQVTASGMLRPGDDLAPDVAQAELDLAHPA